MQPMNWKIVGGAAIGLLAFATLGCALDRGSTQECLREAVHGAISYLLLLGAIGVGIWAGSEAAERSGHAWVGWVVGVLVAFALASLLNWIGYLPEGKSEYDDWG